MKSALNWKTTRQTVSRESLIFHFLLSGLTLRQTSPCSNVTLLVFHLPQWKKSCEEEKTVFLWTEQTGWLAKLVCVNGVLWNVSWAYVECKRKEFNIFVFLLLQKDFCKIKQLLTIFCMCMCLYSKVLFMLVTWTFILLSSWKEKLQQMDSEGSLLCLGSVYRCGSGYSLFLFHSRHNLIRAALPLCVQNWFHL